MKFVDQAVISVRSGHGGKGAVHFMRQRGMPRMGPDGGDGGRGGDVYFEASTGVQSLLDFQFISHYAADDGENGSGNDCNGKDGNDLVIRVPVGTQIFDADSGEFLLDLVEDGARVMLLKGGRGGLGNMNFATATRQAPDFAQPGEKEQSRRIRLELKLLADVGLVGFPNAGKSTLISVVSAAKPKVADYPFTTLIPHLGVVRGKSRDFTVADIPGLIEGASEGKGLGTVFLKHCERTQVLLFVLNIDPDSGKSLAEQYEILNRELTNFSPELAEKPRLVAINKIDQAGADLLSEFLNEQGFAKLKTQWTGKISMISGATREGVDALMLEVEKLLMAQPRETRNQVAEVLLGYQDLLKKRPGDTPMSSQVVGDSQAQNRDD